MDSPCGGCSGGTCDDADCSCVKVCDELMCERHSHESAVEWRRLHPGPLRTEAVRCGVRLDVGEELRAAGRGHLVGEGR